MGSLMEKHLSSPDTYRGIVQSGALSVLYEIGAASPSRPVTPPYPSCTGMESLFLSEGFLEFCSRTTVFLKSQVPVKLGPLEKILFFRDVSTSAALLLPKP
jgi:hypothetical protein